MGADDGSCSGVRHLASFSSLLRVAHAQLPSGFSKKGSGSDTKATEDNNLLLQSFSQTQHQLKNVLTYLRLQLSITFNRVPPGVFVTSQASAGVL